MIRFRCSCGKRLKVDVSEIGHTVECPYCASPVVVPDPDAPPAAKPAGETPVSAPEALAAAMRQLAPTAPRPSRVAPVQPPKVAAARPSKVAAKKAPPPPPRQPQKPGLAPNGGPSKATKPVLIAVAGAFVLVTFLVILAFFFGGSDRKPVRQEAPPVFQASPAPAPEPKPERNLHPPGELFPKVAPTN